MFCIRMELKLYGVEWNWNCVSISFHFKVIILPINTIPILLEGLGMTFKKKGKNSCTLASPKGLTYLCATVGGC